MIDKSPNYYELRIEDSWIEYVRARLPYSFNHIEEKGSSQNRHFVLSDPVLLTGQLAADRHNFWRRGNVYYMSGKLLDYYPMSEVGWNYRIGEVTRLLSGPNVARNIWPVSEFAFYNSMQIDKVWGFAQENHLDRERMMMTNVMLSIELCLKAIATHAVFWDSGCFKFSAGHDIVKLYGALPEALRVEVSEESDVFAREYVAFRTKVEADIKNIRSSHLSKPQASAEWIKQAEAEWNEMARRIRESNYTAFVNSNDPGVGDNYLHEGWFEEALYQVESMGEPGDISQYFRYAPREDKDELPTDLIHWILLLGRFLYEHLFPVPRSDDRPHSGFPAKSVVER